MRSKKRLVRIGPMQLGKMLAALYGVSGLIFVPIFGVMALVGAFAPQVENAPSPVLLGGFAIVAAIAFPLLYALMGFVVGLVGAVIYNLFAKWVGGIEVEVE